MATTNFFDRLLGKRSAEPTKPSWTKPKFDDSYPEHIETWASKLKGQVEGMRKDSRDLQKKYENAPLRRRPSKKKPPSSKR